jgi:hypothetical protein
MVLRENISNEIASPQQVQDASFTGTTGSNNLQNIVKGAKFIDSGFSGWDLVDQDLVAYRDQMRRGLQFLFSLIQKTNMINNNSTFKIVSVYQKGINNEDGDFVVVSRYMNDPHNIRVVDVTNDWYGDPDPEPKEIISKVIEMADGSGMIRNVNEFGDYGKTKSLVETADFDDFTGYLSSMGIITSKDNKPSASNIVNLAKNSGSDKESKVIANAISSATSQVQQPTTLQQVGGGLRATLSNLFKSATSTISKGTSAKGQVTVNPLTVGTSAVETGLKEIGRTQKKSQREYQVAQGQDSGIMKALIGAGAKVDSSQQRSKDVAKQVSAKRYDTRAKHGIGSSMGKQKADFQHAFEKQYEKNTTNPFSSGVGKPGESYGFSFQNDNDFFKSSPSNKIKKQNVKSSNKSDSRVKVPKEYSQPFSQSFTTKY